MILLGSVPLFRDSSVLVRAYSATTIALITRIAKNDPNKTIDAKKLLTNAPDPTPASICVATSPHPLFVNVWNIVKHASLIVSNEV